MTRFAQTTTRAAVVAIPLAAILGLDVQQRTIALLILSMVLAAAFPFVFPARSAWRFGVWSLVGVLAISVLFSHTILARMHHRPGAAVTTDRVVAAHGSIIWSDVNTIETFQAGYGNWPGAGDPGVNGLYRRTRRLARWVPLGADRICPTQAGSI